MAPTFYMDTTADHCPGFPLLLWEVVRDALGASTRPQYVVFRSEDSPAGHEFQAVVSIKPHPDRKKKPYEFSGRLMPTLELAFQVTAFESLARLRWMEPAFVRCRAYFFLPAMPRSGPRIIWANAEKEVDSAVVHLVSYLAAMESLNHSLMAELRVARQSLGPALLQHASMRNPISATQDQAQTQQGKPQIPDPGPSHKGSVPDRLQWALQVPEQMAPYVGLSVLEEAMARVRQQPQEPGVVLEGRPVIPHPPEDADVDTTLRLGTAPPTPRGCQAE